MMAGLPKVQRILGGVLVDKQYDDWVSLILEAKKAGISIEEISSFFSQASCGKQEKIV